MPVNQRDSRSTYKQSEIKFAAVHYKNTLELEHPDNITIHILDSQVTLPEAVRELKAVEALQIEN